MTLITVEQFGQMHFSDIEDYELVDGELSRLPSGTFRHANIRGRLERMLNRYFEQHPIAEVFGEVDLPGRREPDSPSGSFGVSRTAASTRRRGQNSRSLPTGHRH